MRLSASSSKQLPKHNTDMWDMRKADRNRPSMDAIDWTVAMIENKLFGRLDNGE